MNKQEVKEIVSKYPKEIICHPRVAFEEQLKKHLYKHFKILYKQPVKSEKKKEKCKQD